MDLEGYIRKVYKRLVDIYIIVRVLKKLKYLLSINKGRKITNLSFISFPT